MSNIFTSMSHKIEHSHLLGNTITIGDMKQKYACVEVGDNYLELQTQADYEADQKKVIATPQKQKPYYQRGRW